MEMIKATLAVMLRIISVVVVTVEDVDVNEVVISGISTRSGIIRMKRMIKIQLGKWKVCVIIVEHHVELYQQSLKEKGKKMETNFVCENDKDYYGIIGTTHLKIVDFFTIPEGKLIIRSSPIKINYESITFLERIQGDICGPIHPPCGPFRYFMVLLDTSSRW
ncbi:hypothetical protein J1N35_015367, partial [Gossypium stocksii]